MSSAEALKERGNELMRTGDLTGAVARYTEALSIDSNHVASLSNRALAHLKLRQFDQCVDDARAVLKIDANNTKALFRRASALVELKRPEAAMQDFVRLLQLEPDNVVAKEQINRLKWSAKSSARADRLAATARHVPATAISNAAVVDAPPADEIALAAAHLNSASVTSMAIDVDDDAGDAPMPARVVAAAAPAVVVVAPSNADRILSRPPPVNTAQYEMFVTELLTTALPRAEQLALLFRFLSQPSVDVAAFLASEMDDSTLELTIETIATHANASNASLCQTFVRALLAMPRFDVFSMCIDDTTRQRLEVIKRIA